MQCLSTVPGCGLHRPGAFFPRPALCSSKPLLQKRNARKIVAAADRKAAAPAASFQNQVVGLGMALAVSLLSACSVQAKPAAGPDPYQELSNIVSGRNPATEGLFKSFQAAKAEAAKALESAAEVLPAPVTAAAPAAQDGASIADNGSGGLLAIGGVAAAALLATFAGNRDSSSNPGKSASKSASRAVKGGTKQIKARVQGPKRSAKPAPARAAQAAGSKARGLAAAATGTRAAGGSGTRKVAQKPSGGLFGTQRVSGSGTSKISRLAPAQAAKGRGGPTAKGPAKFASKAASKAKNAAKGATEGGIPNSLITAAIVGVIVVSGALFAAIPKPNFYPKPEQKEVDYTAPEPLAAKKNALKYSRLEPAPPLPEPPKEKQTPKPQPAEQKAKPAVPDVKLPELPKPPPVPEAPKLPSLAEKPAPVPAPKVENPAEKPANPLGFSAPPLPSIEKPSAPSGPDLTPSQTKKPETGIPLAAPKTEENKPATPSGPELLQKAEKAAPSPPPLPTPSPPKAEPKPAPAKAAAPAAPAKAAAPAAPAAPAKAPEKAPEKPAPAKPAAKSAKSGITAPTAANKPGTPLTTPTKTTEVSKGKSSSNSLYLVLGGLAAAGVVVALVAPKGQGDATATGGASAAAPSASSSGSSSAGGSSAGSNSKSGSRSPAGQPGESTPEDIKKRKSDVQAWVKDWRSRT